MFTQKKQARETLDQLKEKNRQLERLIRLKHQTILELDHEIEYKTIVKRTGFTQMINNILDLYEKSHIRIPLDIIEDIQTETFASEKEVYDYIENQRLFWKLENQKKPLKREVK